MSQRLLVFQPKGFVWCIKCREFTQLYDFIRNSIPGMRALFMRRPTYILFFKLQAVTPSNVDSNIVIVLP